MGIVRDIHTPTRSSPGSALAPAGFMAGRNIRDSGDWALARFRPDFEAELIGSLYRITQAETVELHEKIVLWPITRSHKIERTAENRVRPHRV